jgi:hypothetical protein
MPRSLTCLGSGGITANSQVILPIDALARRGTPQSIAIDITGHKTMAVFKRYNITDTRDIHAAIERTNAYVEQSIAQTQVKVERPGERDGVEETSLVQ